MYTSIKYVNSAKVTQSVWNSFQPQRSSQSRWEGDRAGVTLVPVLMSLSPLLEHLMQYPSIPRYLQH